MTSYMQRGLFFNEFNAQCTLGLKTCYENKLKNITINDKINGILQPPCSGTYYNFVCLSDSELKELIDD